MAFSTFPVGKIQSKSVQTRKSLFYWSNTIDFNISTGCRIFPCSDFTTFSLPRPSCWHPGLPKDPSRAPPGVTWDPHSSTQVPHGAPHDPLGIPRIASGHPTEPHSTPQGPPMDAPEHPTEDPDPLSECLLGLVSPNVAFAYTCHQI